MSLNILEFVSKYTVSKNELLPRANEVIVGRFPTYYSSDPKGNNYGLYQLLKLKPWQQIQKIHGTSFGNFTA